MSSEPTLGELGRRLDDRLNDVREDIAGLGRRIDGKVAQDVYDVHHKAITDAIAELKAQRVADSNRVAATRRWLIGAVIVPIVAVLLAYMLSRGGAS